MAVPRGFKSADFGGEVAEIGGAPYKPVTITWAEPQLWMPNEPAPTHLAENAPGYLYALVRNHGNMSDKDRIVYIGLTQSLKSRFNQHPTAERFVNKRGKTLLSIGNIDFNGYRTAKNKNKQAIEELEHIFIWALWKTLHNERKVYTLPGKGANGGRAWHITNKGYGFSGRMPHEIVYPWMLIKPRRDYSVRRVP